MSYSDHDLIMTNKSSLKETPANLKIPKDSSPKIHPLKINLQKTFSQKKKNLN